MRVTWHGQNKFPILQIHSWDIRSNFHQIKHSILRNIRIYKATKSATLSERVTGFIIELYSENFETEFELNRSSDYTS